jgi:hypothetical protein
MGEKAPKEIQEMVDNFRSPHGKIAEAHEH